MRSLTTRPIVIMAELTPDVSNFLSDNSLRTMADSVNTQVSEWFRDEWGLTANIVAADFIRGTTLVETALFWNIAKGQTRAILGGGGSNIERHYVLYKK